MAQDEPLADQLNQLLKDRFKVFFYSERQREIAGTDGEKKFGEIFGLKSRLVVILYRKGWGESPWTRIEETAIRNRAYDGGFDFVVVMPLDQPTVVPKWLPKNRLWFGLERFGLNAAAAVIETRIADVGGQPSEESVLERAQRLDRSVQLKVGKKAFLNSDKGVNAAFDELARLASLLEVQVNEIATAFPELKLRVCKAEQNRRALVVGRELSFSTEFQIKYGNTLNDSKFVLSYWNGIPNFPSHYQWSNAKVAERIYFEFDAVGKDIVWTPKSGNPKVPHMRSEQLAAFALKRLMDLIDAKAHSS